ncbi:MAG: T9SS type A sorting domain-containing protein [Prevotella sp.]|nr:T9SS type A sorting domain-containing protein [Prevotella sp.]
MKQILFVVVLYIVPAYLHAQTYSHAQTFVYKHDNNGNVISRTVKNLEDISQDHLSDKITNDRPLDVEISQENEKIIVDVNGVHDKNVDVQLYDASSKLVGKESSTDTRHELDCSTIPDGVYIVEVKCEDKVHSEKVLKK